MRLMILSRLAFIIAVGALAACNSREIITSQLPSAPAQSPQSQPNPADSVRRITAADLHALWEKDKVVIIDTRSEPAYKEGHIKGAILIPAGGVLAKIDELPRNKMIVAYCT